jgi:hypothetical protein
MKAYLEEGEVERTPDPVFYTNEFVGAVDARMNKPNPTEQAGVITTKEVEMGTRQKYTAPSLLDDPLNDDLRALPVTCRDTHWYVLNTRINLVFKHLIPIERHVTEHPEDGRSVFYRDQLLWILGSLQKGMRRHERYLYYAPDREEVAGEVKPSKVRLRNRRLRSIIMEG